MKNHLTIIRHIILIGFWLSLESLMAQETRTKLTPKHSTPNIPTYSEKDLSAIANSSFQQASFSPLAVSTSSSSSNLPPSYSPETEVVNRFKDIPVNVNTGAMSVSTPLYTLQEGNLSVSIVDVFNGSGLKNEELASWCGAGHSLMAGGMITRATKGIPDEGLRINNTNYRGYHRYGFSWQMSPDHDTEPDMFYLQIEGQVYPFQWRYYGDKPTFETYPRSDIKIITNFSLLSGNTVVGKFNSFEVIMPNGTHYFFGNNDTQEETAEAETHDIQDGNKYSGTVGFTNFWKDNAQTSVWYLTKIASPYGQEINFSYDHVEYSYYKLSEHGVTGANGVCPTPSQIEKKINRVFVSSYSLSKIEGINTKIEFNKRYRVCNIRIDDATGENVEICEYQDTSPARLDLDAWYRYPQSQSNAKRLMEMMVMENTALPKDTLFYKFKYGYFTGVEDDLPTGYTTADVGTSHQKRLRLERIDFPDKTAVRFRYRGDDPTYNGKSRLNYGIDNWGYANGFTGNRFLTGLIPKDSDYPTCTASTSNRDTDPAFGFYGSLDSLIYVGRKSIAFVYETHTARNYLNADSTYKPIGGARIKSIKTKDLISGIETLKSYEYTLSNGKTSGFLVMKPTYRFSSILPNQIGSNSHIYERLLGEIGKQPVSYQRVVEKIADTQGNSLGKSIYYFQQNGTELTTKWTTTINCTGQYPNQVCDTVNYLMPELIHPQASPNRNADYPYGEGYMLRAETFNANNDTLSINEWNYGIIGGTSYSPSARVFKVNTDTQLGYNNNSGSHVYYQSYYYGFYGYTLKSEGNTVFSQTGTNPVKTFTEYKYSGEINIYPNSYILKHHLPVFVQNTDSKAKIGSSITKYPLDFDFGTDVIHHDQTCTDEYGSYDCSYDEIIEHVPALGTRARGIYEFQDKHIISFPIETNTRYDAQVAGATHTTIAAFNNIAGSFNYAPQKSYTIGNDAYGSYEFQNMQYQQSNDSISIDYRFKEIGQIDEYNTIGLPIKSHVLGGVITAIDYDASKILPIRTRHNVGGTIIDTTTTEYAKKLFGASKTIGINQLSQSVLFDSTYRKGAIKQVFDKDKNLLAVYDYAEATEIFTANGLNTDASKVRTISRVPRYAVKKLPNSLDSLQISVQYSDGEGRNLQSKSIKSSPNRKDVVASTHIFDTFGRPQKSILPTPTSSINGGFESNIQTTAQSFYVDTAPFSEVKQYEASPLSRATETMSVGQALRPNRKGTQSFETGNFGIRRFYTNGYLEELYLYIEPYIGNQILKTTTTDEQGNKTIAFSDKEGRKLETHVQFTGDGTQPQHYLKTAYIYDRLNRLSGIIPPLAYDLVFNQLYIPASSITNLLYLIRYDEENRIREKHIPDAGWSYFVYNQMGQVVMSQNPLQRSQSLWTWNKYNARGKVIMSGLVSNSTFSRQDLQTKFNAYTATQYLEKAPSSGTGGAFPTDVEALISENDIKIINFYDDYTWLTGNTLAFQKYKSNRWANAKGLLTGTKVRRLDTGQWLRSAFYYDDQNRLIQSQSENRFGTVAAPSINQTDVVLDFAGKVLEERTLYRKPSQATNESKTVYSYDFAGRKTQATHYWNGKGEILASYDYDELSQLIRKRLNEAAQDSIIRPSGGLQSESIRKGVVDVAKKYVLLLPGTTVKPDSTYCAYISTGLQHVTYSYNVQGNLRGINLTPAGALDPNKVFSLKLDYMEDGRYFNGLLSKQSWKSQQDTTTRSYLYDYDKANRYTTASFTGKSNEKYNENVSYDDNGNILKLNRYGVLSTPSGAGGLIDSLAYFYEQNANRLTGIIDYSASQKGHKDNGSANDYSYDYWHKNLRADANKGITDIVYNYLGLQDEIIWSSTQKIKNIYTADGIKLAEWFINGTDTTKTEYVGDLIYRNGILSSAQHDEGIIKFSPTGQATYQYFINDHLGSLRVIFQKANSNVYIAQRADYYPFGGLMEGLSSSLTADSWNHLYQGNQYIEFNGYNLYDFNLRQYDAWLGQFTSTDPVLDFNVGSRVAMLNNPLIYTDPNGDCPICLLYAGAAVFGGVSNLATNWNKVKNWKQGVAYFASGAIGGAMTIMPAAGPAAGGATTAALNMGIDIVTGNMPKFDNSWDGIKYMGGLALDGFGVAGSGSLVKWGFSKLAPLYFDKAISSINGVMGFINTGSTAEGFALESTAEVLVKPAVNLAPQSATSQLAKQGLNFADDAGQKLLPAPKTIARHHIFPQEFKPFFKKAGININNYTIEMEHFSTHLKGVHGNGLFNMPGKWNLRWEEFISANPNATAGQIFKYGEDLMAEYGFRFSRFVKYR